MLAVEQLGRVTNFVAVPGCGLKCDVTNVEALLNGCVTDVEIMNRRNSTVSNNVAIDTVSLGEEVFGGELLGRTIEGS